MIREDYTKYSNRQVKTKASEIQKELSKKAVVTSQPDKAPIEDVKEKRGVVSNCLKLNVRCEASVDSDVVCEITASTELMIDETNSTKDFYKVYTAAGAEGFCMKKFITIVP
jgi:uncharacterized protein YgiM (DUF1202 family)